MPLHDRVPQKSAGVPPGGRFLVPEALSARYFAAPMYEPRMAGRPQRFFKSWRPKRALPVTRLPQVSRKGRMTVKHQRAILSIVSGVCAARWTAYNTCHGGWRLAASKQASAISSRFSMWPQLTADGFPSCRTVSSLAAVHWVAIVMTAPA